MCWERRQNFFLAGIGLHSSCWQLPEPLYYLYQTSGAHSANEMQDKASTDALKGEPEVYCGTDARAHQEICILLLSAVTDCRDT